jgi:hypothetical protein
LLFASASDASSCKCCGEYVHSPFRSLTMPNANVGRVGVLVANVGTEEKVLPLGPYAPLVEELAYRCSSALLTAMPEVVATGDCALSNATNCGYDANVVVADDRKGANKLWLSKISSESCAGAEGSSDEISIGEMGGFVPFTSTIRSVDCGAGASTTVSFELENESRPVKKFTNESNPTGLDAKLPTDETKLPSDE